ncbi:MAG: NAD(P)/FAD-dependent oxidoreductase [Thermomicrobiales bacterium]
MYDAIIVGARCAGSPLAMLLARQGHKVLLVDKGSFPSDIMSTHGLKPPATAKLKEWGLLDSVLVSNCPPVHTQELNFGPFSLSGSSPGVDGVRFLVAPRRKVLDTILVDAAVAAGAELREHFTVGEVLFEDGIVTGIRGHERGGREVTERARIVIGADGRHSDVAKAVGVPTIIDRGTFCCAYYSYFSGVPTDRVTLYPRPGRFAITFPTNDDLTVVLVEWPREEFQPFGRTSKEFPADARDGARTRRAVRATGRALHWHGRPAELPTQGIWARLGAGWRCSQSQGSYSRSGH